MNGSAPDPQIDFMNRDETTKFLGQTFGLEYHIFRHERSSSVIGPWAAIVVFFLISPAP
jgi:hypothetical protein